MNPDILSEITLGDVVQTTAGRDQGKLFYVIHVENAYVMLANGKDRPLDRPKHKKRKHVEKVLRSETRVADKLRAGDKVLNGELRRDLADLCQNMQSNTLGG